MTLLTRDCPTCGITVRTRAEDVRMYEPGTPLNPTARPLLRIQCPNCGYFNISAPFWTIGRLLEDGMPEPLTDHDHLTFVWAIYNETQRAKASGLKGAPLSAIAAMESGEVPG